jgi:hypothetical protein
MSNSRTFRRRLGVTGVAAALVFGGVACGNGDDATSAAPQTTAAMAEPDASTSETTDSDVMAARTPSSPAARPPSSGRRSPPASRSTSTWPGSPSTRR